MNAEQPESRTRRGRAARRAAAEAKRPNIVPPGLEANTYKPLTEAGLRRIHEAALDVLERTGIQVLASECRDVFKAAGARVVESRDRVYISRAMVEDAVASAARELVLCGRDPQYDLRLSGCRVYMGTGGAAVKVLDLETGQARQTVLADVARIGRLVDALDNIHFYLRACVAHDCTNEQLDVNTAYAAFTNTSKHVMVNAFSPRGALEVLDIAALIAGSPQALEERPIVSFTSCWVVSPLRYAPETVETLTALIRNNAAVALSSAPQAGATSPASLAGTLVQITAEELSGVVYTNLLRPGARVMMGFVPSVADLRSGNFTGGATEFALMNAAGAQIGQFYGIPVYNSSALTDSKVPDVQAGYEKGITSLAAALAGSNFIHHSAGMLESLLTVAYEQYVIDDDINGSVMRGVRGIEVGDDQLAVDLIDKVCNGEGHFLGTDQSLALMNTEYYYPHTADRRRRGDWEEAGSPDMREAARRQARDILATHKPTPIPASVDAAIRDRYNILLPQDLASIGE
jgi:trimethylamine--corrinoid protein Co-methyltransferase